MIQVRLGLGVFEPGDMHAPACARSYDRAVGPSSQPDSQAYWQAPVPVRGLGLGGGPGPRATPAGPQFAKDSWDSELRTLAARCLVVPVTVGDSEAEAELKSNPGPSQTLKFKLLARASV